MPRAKKQPDNEHGLTQDMAIAPDWRYEQAVAEVEAIIKQIELGELELADVFDQFSAAVAQLQQCEQFLNQQRHRVDLLIETLTDKSEEF